MSFVFIIFRLSDISGYNESDMSSILTNDDITILSNDDFEADPRFPNPKIVVAEAEARARTDQKRNGSRALRGSGRQYADALHREADALHHKGDYESALILYHRAAKICPRDSSHGVAARRTMAAINSATNPSKSLIELLPQVKNNVQLAAALCPETAALRASSILKSGPADPSSVVSQMLRYFDHRRADFWRTPSVSRDPGTTATKKLTRSRIVRRQLISLANASLKNMEASFATGDSTATLKIGEEVLHLISGLRDPHRYRVAVYHLIALTYVSMGRHDRAVSNVARMVHFAVRSKDIVLRTKSLVTLGKVHLTFGHLDAVARAWGRLADDLEEPVPRAWVQHEIGRCFFESGRHLDALFMADCCFTSANVAGSKKWLLHGKLLAGQALIKLGKLEEALKELRVSAKVTEEEGDTPTLSYVRELINRVTEALKRVDSGLEDRDTSKTSSDPRVHQDLPKTAGRSEMSSTKFVDSDEEDSSSMDRRISAGPCSNYSSSDEINSLVVSRNDCNYGSTDDEESSSRRPRPDGKKKPCDRLENATGTSSSFAKSTLGIDMSPARSKSLIEEDLDKLDTSRTRVLRTVAEIPGKYKNEDAEDGTCRSIDKFSWLHKCEDPFSGSINNPGTADMGPKYDLPGPIKTSIESLVPTGRTYDIGSPHALYRHSLPSTPRQRNLTVNESCVCEGFTAIFEAP